MFYYYLFAKLTNYSKIYLYCLFKSDEKTTKLTTTSIRIKCNFWNLVSYSIIIIIISLFYPTTITSVVVIFISPHTVLELRWRWWKRWFLMIKMLFCHPRTRKCIQKVLFIIAVLKYFSPSDQINFHGKHFTFVCFW